MQRIVRWCGRRLRTVGGWFSQSEWMVRLLNLARASEPRSDPGLVLIQIDGLGWTEFRRGLRKGDLPFLKRLGRPAHGYISYPHYSGMPSNTPGVQGELFYGVKTCVPAFSFVDREGRRVRHMFNQASALAVEARLQHAGDGLLSGGSSYGNIFSGGASAPHFCSMSMGWVGLLKALNPPALALAVLLNLHIAARAALLAALETVLAVVDCGRGLLNRRDFTKELTFIPMRVAICIILREIITAAARVDIARGLRVIHVNLAGYDEQAHHRGPHSALARWSLRGIDSAADRIWRAAARAGRREYAVWIYSDHGQEEVLPYPQEHGRSIHAAVAEVFERHLAQRGWGIEQTHAAPHWRANLLRPQASVEPPEAPEGASKVIVAAMGPIGHLYPPQELAPEETARLADALVREAKIPLVLVAAAPGQARAWTPEGMFELPRDAREVFGGEHPYLKEVAEDLVTLCHHPDAGTFVISAWRKRRPGTFPMEFGAHAGPGPEETNGFACLPPGALTLPAGQAYVRNEDLRAAARRRLARAA